MRFLRTYRKPLKLEMFTSLLLVISTVVALFMYNSSLKPFYDYIFDEFYLFNSFSLHEFINDFLMAIFFLVAGLEIKHEILYGNLSSFKQASFPVIASIGGVIVPALIFIFFNKNTDFLNGFCIPISTDIAFAVGVFLIFSKKLNPSLKVFLLSLAVVDDLISIFTIGAVYSLDVNFYYLSLALFIFMTLIIANKIFNIRSITYYLCAGFCLWYFIFLSGVHCTISGILLATTIPAKHDLGVSSLERLQRLLVPINSLIIIPLFAFANTGVSLSFDLLSSNPNYPLLFNGILLGLLVGKPIGIMLFTYLGCLFNITEKPSNISWFAVFLVSLIAGIGFTMSIFISEIAFVDNDILINISKSAILLSSISSILATSIAIKIYDYLRYIKSSSKAALTNKYYIS